jgi:hypothetical protein
MESLPAYSYHLRFLLQPDQKACFGGLYVASIHHEIVGWEGANPFCIGADYGTLNAGSLQRAALP